MMNYVKVGILAVLVLIGLALSGSVIENVDADEILVVQHPTNGTLTCYTSPGIKWQGFGKVTFYRKQTRQQLEAKVMFNDNGTGVMTGEYQVAMPLDCPNLIQLHTLYGSQEAIEQSLVAATINKVVYMTGPLMSSKESSAERKTDLIRYVTDQIDNGVYRTVQKTVTVDDVMSKEKRTVTVAEISMKEGKPERQEKAVLTGYVIQVANFAPKDLDYDDRVKKQISDQQSITMQVQTARAQALEAEQRRITAEADGKAAVMKSQYEKEQEKIKEVVMAQQRLEVARLDAQAAEQTKRKEILLGEGESTRKRLVMTADGALEKKLEAIVKINAQYAQAIEKHQGPWVPSVVMGGSQGVSGATVPGGAAIPLIDLLTAKTAKDLGISLAVTGREQTGR
jgi:hypothetical protein